MKRQILWIALFTAAGVMAASAETINAAGATFPAPIYQKWFEDFHKAHSDIQINYQAIGSGGGIRMLSQKTVDFVDTNNTFPKGHFAIQQHDPGTVIMVRKALVKELPTKE